MLDTLQNFDTLVKGARPQSEEGVVLAPKITPAMLDLDWVNSDVRSIYNRWRAFGDTLGVHTYYSGMRLKVFKIEPPGMAAAHTRN